MESPAGCPVLSTGGLNKHNGTFWWTNAIYLMVLGGFFLSVGGRFPLLTLFLLLTASVGTILIVGIYTFVLPAFVPDWTVWLLGIICYGMGAGLGLGSLRWPKMGISIVGIFTGFLLGELIYIFLQMTEI